MPWFFARRLIMRANSRLKIDRFANVEQRALIAVKAVHASGFRQALLDLTIYPITRLRHA
jgi:hypothetical protein